MTLQEAISDKNRPLSMTPQEWMQYTEAHEEEETENADCISKSKYEYAVSSEGDGIVFSSEEKLEIGIEQMVLGCSIALRALNEIARMDETIEKRRAHDGISDIVNKAIAPYLADIMKFRKELYG